MIIKPIRERGLSKVRLSVLKHAISLSVTLALGVGFSNAAFCTTAQNIDLIYTQEDLPFKLERATHTFGETDIEAVLSKLLGKNAFLIPLLQLDRADRRETLKRLLQLQETVKAIDLKDLGTFETALRSEALASLWSGIQELRGKKVSEAQLGGLKRAVEIYGTLVDLSRRLGNIPKRGRYAYMLAMAREELARHIKDPEKVRLLKSLIREDLLEALEAIGSPSGKEATETEEAKEAPVTRTDIEEKLKTLDQELGGISPLTPLPGHSVTMTSNLGMRRHPKTGRMRRHDGIDLAGAGCDGWNVSAIGPGRVIRSDWSGGYGYLVVLRHELDSGVFYSRYGHMRREGRATTGTVVGRGDKIGLCNNSGVSTGSHLHFEVRRNFESGQVIDPKPLLIGPLPPAARD